MFVITIAREYGSGGLDIANQVARQLNVPCVDREIISRAAEKAGVTEATAEELDERRPPFLEHLFEQMGRYGDADGFGSMATVPSMYTALDYSNFFDSDKFHEVIEEAIRSIAAQTSAVIVGRAGQVILRDCPNALHVRIVANQEFRVKYVMERDKLDKEAAEKHIKLIDGRRADYLKGYYNAEWHDPHLYDLVLNSSRLGLGGCVELIRIEAERRGWLTTGLLTRK